MEKGILKMMSKKLILVAALSAVVSTMWAATPEDAERLGKDLTPFGAEKAGNKDGTIPAWSGQEPPTAGWSYGKFRGDYWKYKGEKPLFTINASNVDKYADKLAPGQVDLIKKIKDYRMDVYPTHRDCGFPDFTVENTKKNATEGAIGEDGWSLKNAQVPGIPFPLPKTGLEAMWNTKFRYRGMGIDMPRVHTAVSPRKGSSEWIDAISKEYYYFPWGNKESKSLKDLPKIEYYTYFAYDAPAALAGQAALIRVNTDKPMEADYYFPGQRRVRRMPSYAYDSPQIGFENQYTMDEPQMFNGPLDRFNFKLIGKKEIYVPYNAFGMYDFRGQFHDVMQDDAVNPARRRYELHRVLEVEATVKPGVRHISPKKTFYIDEDSWTILLSDDYDGQGKLWKSREGWLIPAYEVGSCDNLTFVQYNLVEGRYVDDLNANGTGKDVRWLPESNDARFKESFYTPENLRAIQER